MDDLNMPKLDPYETAMPISLIRQHLSWGHWFGEYRRQWLITSRCHWPYHKQLCMSSIIKQFSVLFCRPHQADTQEHQQHAVCGVHEPYCWQLRGQPTPAALVHDAGSRLPWSRQLDDNLRDLHSGTLPIQWMLSSCCSKSVIQAGCTGAGPDVGAVTVGGASWGVRIC